MTDLITTVQSKFDATKADADKTLNDYIEEFASVKHPENLNRYIPTIKQLGFILSDISTCEISFDYSIIENLKEEYRKSRMDNWVKQGDELESELSSRMAEIETSTRQRVEESNKRVTDEFAQGNEAYVELEHKRQIILKYQDAIVNLCSEYGITSNDVAIDNDTFPLEEWNAIYDNSLDYIKRNAIGVNPITKFKELVDDKLAQTILVIVIFVMSLTPLLNMVAIFFFILILYSEFTAKGKMEKFAIMLGLIYNIKPLEMGYVDSIDSTKLIDIDEAIDSNPETDELIDWYESQISEYEESNPETTIDIEMDNLTTKLYELTTDCEEFVEDYYKRRNEQINIVESKIEELKMEFEEEKKKVKLLGDNRAIHLAYNSSYMLGLKDGIIPEYVETGLRNIIFKPCEDELLMKKFIQCMLVNAYCNVKVTSLAVTVCDPNNFGRDLIAIYNDNIDSVFKISTDKMDKVISSFAEQAQKNMRILRGKNIQDYNTDCEKTGKTAIGYNLIIVLSQAKEEKEDKKENGNKDEALDSFMRYSAESGIFVWVISSKEYEDTFIFRKPFEGVLHPYEIDENEFLIKFGDEFGLDIKNAKPEGLPWKDYLKCAFKGEDDFWNVSTNEYVMLEPGLVDGDPSRPDFYTVGNDGNIHAIIAGTSGAGKSVAINQFLGNMTLRHSPKELRLWLIDFKGSEFSLYLKSLGFPYQLPHIDACLCTSDPDYSKSLFRAIREEADRRYKILKDLKFRNIVEFNNEMRRNGREDEIFSRIIFLVDEFQVIYTKADNKTIESVNMDITLLAKVARAAGVHIIFCSQSMKGTVSSDTLNMFGLRFCLRCEEEVSQQILGTPYAGNIRQKFGILYARSVEDQSPEMQKRFKTPFQKDNKMVEEHIKRMALEAEKIGFKNDNVIEYDETTKHSVDELNQFYEQSLYPLMQSGEMIGSGTIVLGRRMSYSTNRAPENIILDAVNKSNIFSAFRNMNDLVNFFFSLKRNFDLYSGKYQVIYNAQVDDLHYMCHLDEIVPPNLQKLSTPKTSMVEMVKLFNNMYEKRLVTKDASFPIIFVCLGWADAVGFGIEPDHRNVIEKMSTLIQIAGEMNLHWIFINTAKNNTPTTVLKACDYKICGRVDESTALAVVDTPAAGRPSGDLEDSYAYLLKKGDLSKFKIYQTELTRIVKKSEIVI